MQKNISKTQLNIIKYVSYFVLILILSRANIIKTIWPFSFGVFFALIYLKQNVFILSGFYFFSSILINLSFESAIISLSTIVVAVLMVVVFKSLKKNINLISTFLFALFSQSGYLYYNTSSSYQVILSIVYLLIGLMFLYVCIETFKIFFYRGVSSRYTIDEGICCSIFLIALFSGIQGIFLLGVNITTMLVVFMILIASRTIDKSFCVLLSALAGLGMSFANCNLTNVAIYISFALVCLIVKDCKKIVAPICLILTDLVFGLFLNAYFSYSYLNIISIFVPSLIYLFLPQSFLQKISGLSFTYEGSLINDYLIYGEKDNMKKKFNELSILFNQMQTAYRNLSIGELDKNYACKVLSNEMLENYCSKCIYKKFCVEKENIPRSIEELFLFGIEKGKINILDANNYLTTNCKALSGLISQSNNMLNEYFDYEKQIKVSDSNKMMICEQLEGTENIFNELKNVCVGGEKIDKNLTKEILDELTTNKIIVNEGLVVVDNSGVKKVFIVVKNKYCSCPELLKSFVSIFKMNFIVQNSYLTKYSGWSLLILVPAPKYRITLGLAGKGKDNKISGDTYSLTKISYDKCLFAITDGMGHGKNANEIAGVVLSLVENFYKAGFSSQTTIASINNLMLPSGKDNFSTLDAVKIDLSNGVADFIKLGSSVSVIKSENTYKVVSCECAPIGIIQEVAPKIQRVCLKNQDIIVLASDGVVDAFGSVDNYINFVNNEKFINVQMLADDILEEASSFKSLHDDDMTIIAIKIALNI